MTRAPRVWVLNLDAEDELASPATYGDPFAALAARPQLREALADLVRLDVVLARGGRATPGAVGRTFSPTPRALGALAKAGAALPPAPDVNVLRRVADRRFGLGLGGGHVPGALVLASGGLNDVVARIPGARVFKRVFGFAGRGRHLTRGGAATPAEQAFVDRALRADGAVVVEPWLERTLDVGVHGFVPALRSAASAPRITAGSPTIQVTTAAGAWRSTRRAAPGEVSPAEVEALTAQVGLVGRALVAAGYFGPFGIDAFRHAGPHGPELVPRCEVNARYTMGWAVGMGEQRPDLEP